MTDDARAADREIPIRDLRPHSRLLVDAIVFLTLSLGGAALALAGARIVSLGGSAAGFGWGLIAVGVLIGAALAALGFQRLALRTTIEACGNRGMLRAFPLSSRMDDGTVYAALPDGSKRRWRLDGRRPLLLLGEPPRLLGVEAVGRDGPPVGVAEDGYPFAAGPAVQDLLAAAAELARQDSAAHATERDAAHDGAPPEVVRPVLPITRSPDTALARRARWRVLTFTVVPVLTALYAIRSDSWVTLCVTFLAVLAVATLLGRRPGWLGMHATVTVDDDGIRLKGRSFLVTAPWDCVASVRVRAVPAGGGIVTGISGVPGVLAALTGSGGASDTPALADDPLVRRLVALGMGVAPVLPDVRIVVQGRPGRLHLPGSHDWHIAHAILAEAFARGVDVEFG